MDDITFFFIVGVIQGILEWLPVSSSGNVTLLVVNLTHIPFSEAVKVSFFLHAGTMLSVLIKFRSHILSIVRDAVSLNRTPVLTFYITATVISAGVGIPLYMLFDTEIPELIGSLVIVFFLVITGIIIRYQKRRLKPVEKTSLFDAFVVGAAQGVAVIPGISRSGLTVSALLSRGVDQEEALRMSFLLSIPPVVGLLIVTFSAFHWVYAVSLITSFVCSLLSMEILLKMAQKLDFSYFCFALAAVTGCILIFLY